MGPPDGVLDLAVANSGASLSVSKPGPPEIVVLPRLLGDDGRFVGFGAPHRIAEVVQPLDIKATDLNDDGLLDLAVVDRNELLTIFSTAPQRSKNDTFSAAQDLGVVVHLVEPTLTITPDNDERYFKLTVPKEAVRDSQDAIIDISSGINHVGGAGIQMEVFSAEGQILAKGSRVRLRAPQGSVNYVRISGIESNGVLGTGAYTLVINTLPQVVAVEAQALLPGIGGKPGSSASSLVVTFQGDRLDPLTAQDPENYRVVYWGPDGIKGTGDDSLISLGGTTVTQPIIYDASANLEVTSGLTYPTAVKQTVTLIFDAALPVGSYTVELSEIIKSDSYNDQEEALLSERERFGYHSLVQQDNGIKAGFSRDFVHLVQPTTAIGDLSSFAAGTSFLTQLQNDLQVLLDGSLTELGDDPGITRFLLEQIRSRVLPGLGTASRRATSLLILFFDPFPFSITNRNTAEALGYNRQANTLNRSSSQAYVQVGRNLDFVVIPRAQGSYQLEVSNLPPLPRMGAIILSQNQTEFFDLTTDVRGGRSSFEFRFDVISPANGTLKTSFRQQISATTFSGNARNQPSLKTMSNMALTVIPSPPQQQRNYIEMTSANEQVKETDSDDESGSSEDLEATDKEGREPQGEPNSNFRVPITSEKDQRRSLKRVPEQDSETRGVPRDNQPTSTLPPLEQPRIQPSRGTHTDNEVDSQRIDSIMDAAAARSGSGSIPFLEGLFGTDVVEVSPRSRLLKLHIGSVVRNWIVSFWSLFT